MVALFDDLYQLIESKSQLKAMLTQEIKRGDDAPKITLHRLPKQKAQWKTERNFRK